MQWLTHKNQRVGVEGDFAIDEGGHLVTDTEDLRTLGLVDGGPVLVAGVFAEVVGIPTRERVELRAHTTPFPVGPVDRVFIGRLTYRHGDKPIEAVG